MTLRNEEKSSTIVDIDVLIDHLNENSIQPENLGDEVFNYSQREREYFAEQYCLFANSAAHFEHRLSLNQQALFKLVIANENPVITTNKKFIQFLAMIKNQEIDDCFNNLFHQLKIRNIEVSEKSIDLILELIQYFHHLKKLNLDVEVLRKAISNIITMNDLNACFDNVSRARNDIVKIITQPEKQAINAYSDSLEFPEEEMDDHTDPVDKLLATCSPNETHSTPKKDYSLLKWFLVGALIGLIIAGIIVASVVSVGAVPATLTIMTGVITAVCSGVGTSLFGGVVSAAIKKFKDRFNVSETSKPQMRLTSTDSSKSNKLIYYSEDEDIFNGGNNYFEFKESSELGSIIETPKVIITEKSADTAIAKAPRAQANVAPSQRVHNLAKGKEEMNAQEPVNVPKNNIPAPISKSTKSTNVAPNHADAMKELTAAVDNAVLVAPKNKRGMFQNAAPEPLREMKSVLQAIENGTYKLTAGLIKLTKLAERFGGKQHPIFLAAKACLKSANNDSHEQNYNINTRHL